MKQGGEFSLLHENASEVGLPWKDAPLVSRRSIQMTPNQSVSSILWGQAGHELVLLHGGGQNAHTWDTVAIALARPLIAIDLPGHGHSDWRPDRDYTVATNAQAVSKVIEELTLKAKCIVGMSIGGLTAIRLASKNPQLFEKLVVIDITPNTLKRFESMSRQARGAVSLMEKDLVFQSLEEMVEVTRVASPKRSLSSLRRGVIHNSRKLPDGTWRWRYDRMSETSENSSALWEQVSELKIPTLLVRGGASEFVSNEDELEFRRHIPSVKVVTIEGAGHSVQGDRPLQLAEVIEEFVT